MLKTFSTLLIALILTFSLSACNKTEQSNKADESTTTESSNTHLKRYGMKSGMVEYELSGVQTGTQTMYWDDWGMKQVEFKIFTTNYAGVSIDSNEATLMLGDWIYTYDTVKKTGTKMKNTILKELSENSGNKDLGEIGLEMLKSTGATKTGTENIAGKTCDLYEAGALSTSTCIWKAVTLKMMSDMAGMNIEVTATKVDTDSSLPENIFELPKDVEFKDMGNIKEMMKNL